MSELLGSGSEAQVVKIYDIEVHWHNGPKAVKLNLSILDATTFRHGPTSSIDIWNIQHARLVKGPVMMTRSINRHLVAMGVEQIETTDSATWG